MTSDTTRTGNNHSPTDPLLLVRTGIILYIAIAETIWTFGMFMREIYISVGTEPKNIELYTRCTELLVLLISVPFVARFVKNKIKKASKTSIEKLLMYIIFVLTGTVLLTLLHNHSLVYLYPKSYWNHLSAYQEHLQITKHSQWLQYYFELVKYIIIGILFMPGRERST